MMYGSPANSKDLNLRIPAASIKHGKEESDLAQNQQQQQMSSGLLRYRSAPSSLLGEMCESFFPPRSSTGEAETMFARFVSPDLRDQIGEKSSPHRSIRFLPEIEREAGEASHQQNGGFPSSAPHVAAYHASSSPVTVEGSYRVATSTAMESERESGGARRSAPIRQSSSPASLFSLLSAENGKTLVPHFSYPPPTFIPAAIPAMNCIDLCRFLCVERNRRVQVRKLFQRRSQSVQQPDEMPDKLLLEAVVVLEFDVADLRDRGRGHGRKQPRRRRPLLHPRAARRCLGRSLRRLLHRHEEIQRSVGSSGTIPRLLPSDRRRLLLSRFLARCLQIGEAGSGHIPTLAHHFSLPKTSSEMAAVLQFQDAIPCKIRAKRGCATHPRSIAERVIPTTALSRSLDRISF